MNDTDDQPDHSSDDGQAENHTGTPTNSTGENQNGTESEQSAPRTSERNGNGPLSLTELRRRGAINRKIIEGNDEERFYRELDQAKILCQARNSPPDGLGLRGDEYEVFSAELGYAGKSGKTLPRLFQPYGEKVVAWVQSEQEKANARGLKYDFPTWRKAYQEMTRQWEPPKKGKNSRTENEELKEDEEDDPAVERARLTAEVAAAEQRFKTELWRREELADNLRQAEEKQRLAEERIAELEAEVDRLKDALGQREATSAIEPAPTIEPSFMPPGTVTGLGPISLPVSASQARRRSASPPSDIPEFTPPRKPPPKPIISVKHLKNVTTRALKILDQPDLTCAKVLAQVNPVWESLDTANFDGDAIAAFRSAMVSKLWGAASDTKFSIKQEPDQSIAWYGGNPNDPSVLVWSPRGFAIKPILGQNDPHDDLMIEFRRLRDVAWQTAQITKWVPTGDSRMEVNGRDLNDGIRDEIMAPVQAMWSEYREAEMETETDELFDKINGLIEQADGVPPDGLIAKPMT